MDDLEQRVARLEEGRREIRAARDQFMRETVFQELALVLDLTDEAWLKRHLDAAFVKAAIAWDRAMGDHN